MAKKATTDNIVQTELFPSEKSERAFNFKEQAKARIIEQNTLSAAINKSYLIDMQKHLKNETLLSVDDRKKISDVVRNQSTWLKQTVESNEMIEKAIEDALLANSGTNLDLSNMSNEDLDTLLVEWY